MGMEEEEEEVVVLVSSSRTTSGNRHRSPHAKIESCSRSMLAIDSLFTTSAVPQAQADTRFFPYMHLAAMRTRMRGPAGRV